MNDALGDVTGILDRPDDARWVLLLAHGAGAGPRHAFMEEITSGLAARSMATLRYAFPYVEQGRRAPSPRNALLATVRSAVDAAATHCGDLPLLAGRRKSRSPRCGGTPTTRSPWSCACATSCGC